jgi:glutamate decarboxylase
LIHDGSDGVPGCVWTLKRGKTPGFSLYDLANQLRTKGWQIPAYPMAPKRGDLVLLRVVTRLGVSRDLAGLLIDDLQRAVRYLQKNPPPRSLNHLSAGGYSHT